VRPPRKSKAAAVGVLTKVLRIFDALQRSPAGLRLKQISEQTRLNKSTAYRFLSHLEREGYLIREEHGVYMLGMRLFELASASNHESTLRRIATPVLRDVLRVTGETVNLGVLHGLSVVYLEVLESGHEFRMVSRVGARQPIYSTGLGKALAAFLPPETTEKALESVEFQPFTPHTITSFVQFKEELAKIRERGFAIDNEELFLGVRCISAPILNSSGEAIAAISVAGPTSRISDGKVALFGTTVRDAAHAISVRIGFSMPPSPLQPEFAVRK
jgi:IclR family KDG regulon transcriptional repressor